MFAPADIAIYDRHGQLTAIAEIKNILGTTGEWAARTRRNILAHGGWLGAQFLLFITRDRLYMWKNAGADPVPVQPNYDVDSRLELVPYFNRAGLDPSKVSRPAFESLVGDWLNDLTLPHAAPRQLVEGSDWLVRSGFLSAVKGGRIAYDAAA